MATALENIAKRATTTERIVEEMFTAQIRIYSGTEKELAREIDTRRLRAAGSTFGRINPLLLDVAKDLDTSILAARIALGISTPTIAEHLARLEENGPWLEDLDVPDSRTWDLEQQENGRIAQVHHALRLMSTTTFRDAEVAGRSPMRRDESVLRKMRARYEEAHPAPDETPEP